MNFPFLQSIFVGLLSLLSMAIGFFLQYWLDKKKHESQLKMHPLQVVYDKQTEFFDRLAPLLFELNRYISTIDVWLGESTSDARKKAKEAATDNVAVTKFNELLQQYYMYLPAKLLKEAKELFFEYLHLSTSLSHKQVFDNIENLFSFQNSIREFVGVDKLSHDLLKVIGSNKESR
jgi:hypothetical protein